MFLRGVIRRLPLPGPARHGLEERRAVLKSLVQAWARAVEQRGLAGVEDESVDRAVTQDRAAQTRADRGGGDEPRSLAQTGQVVLAVDHCRARGVGLDQVGSALPGSVETRAGEVGISSQLFSQAAPRRSRPSDLA